MDAHESSFYSMLLCGRTVADFLLVCSMSIGSYRNLCIFSYKPGDEAGFSSCLFSEYWVIPGFAHLLLQAWG